MILALLYSTSGAVATLGAMNFAGVRESSGRRCFCSFVLCITSHFRVLEQRLLRVRVAIQLHKKTASKSARVRERIFKPICSPAF